MPSLNGSATRPICQILSPAVIDDQLKTATLPGQKGFVNIGSDDERLFNHTTLKDAQREAERLATEKGLTVIVYQPLLIVSPPKPRYAEVHVIDERIYNTRTF